MSTMSLRFSPLLAWCAVFLFATAAQAQVVRPSESIYLLLRGGATGYYGDYDGNSDNDPDDAKFKIGDGFDDPGGAIGGEIGYHFSPNFSFGIGGVYHFNLLFDGVSNAFTNNVQGGETYQLQALFRYLPFDETRISPFIEFGGALVSGQGTENEQEVGGDPNKDLFGYGPVLGLGLDLALTPQLGLFLSGQTTVVFPDAALDGGNPGEFGLVADDYDGDFLTTLGGGLRFALRAPYTPVEIEGLECPAELTTGEAGRFAVTTNLDATTPVTTTWAFGDGSTGSGASTTHAFSSPGTYTVTASAENVGGDDAESCLVTVVRPAPTLAGCRATPASVETGGSVTVNATATEADEVTVDFGDGTTATTLPARHAYAEAGTYTVTITAENESGSDTCQITVTVNEPVDAFCADITELNPVFFGFQEATLSADARQRLDENIEVLRRCPDICVTINAYADDQERSPLPLSQRRADAVRDYYVAQGIDASRLRAIGRGVAPDANSKEDPGPGDARARRADSIPSSCAGF